MLDRWNGNNALGLVNLAGQLQDNLDIAARFRRSAACTYIFMLSQRERSFRKF